MYQGMKINKTDEMKSIDYEDAMNELEISKCEVNIKLDTRKNKTNELEVQFRGKNLFKLKQKNTQNTPQNVKGKSVKVGR